MVRIGLIGSEKIHSDHTYKVVKELSKFLNELSEKVEIELYTGGTGGAPYLICESFENPGYIKHYLPETEKETQTTRSLKLFDYTFQISSPVNVSPYVQKLNCGYIEFHGKTMEERRILLINQCDIIIMLEGGPGSVHESLIATQIPIPIFCFPSTGGASSGMFFTNKIDYNKITKLTIDTIPTILATQIILNKI